MLTALTVELHVELFEAPRMMLLPNPTWEKLCVSRLTVYGFPGGQEKRSAKAINHPVLMLNRIGVYFGLQKNHNSFTQSQRTPIPIFLSFKNFARRSEQTQWIF